MGSIIAQNLIEHGVKPAQIKAIDNFAKHKIRGIKYFNSASDLPKNYQADLVILAIKPQDCENILRDFAAAQRFCDQTIFVSILAGKKIEFFEEIFGSDAKIIRSMPNLPIQDHQGIFAYYLNQNLKKDEVVAVKKLFAGFGEVLEVENEKLFDAITAIFGSGPAFIFYLQEIFSDIAFAQGIDQEKIHDLIRKLFLGSALMACNSDASFMELRESVTSKKGTTDAALQILQKDNALKNLFKDAINQAVQRSKELSQ